MQPAVLFDGVWKKFRRGERHDSLRDLIPSIARRMLGRSRNSEVDVSREFWALEDVSFSVAPGEALGIIGPNGAGKSTSLKLLTKILRPNRGRSEVHGRVGALIEVAAGFHPDLTGRENIFLQGAIMGMRRAEVERKLDTIIDFAGVADFIDTQVKRYSSGMNARLGFAIAAHLEPDVLIIDEVLAVGDAAFQERCLTRMKAIRDSGTTLIFVSHDLQAVGNLCDQALYLNHQVRAIGETADVIGAYLRDSKRQAVAGTAAPVVIERARLLDANGVEVAEAASTSRLQLQVDIRVTSPIPDLTLGLILYRSTDHLILHEANVVGDQIGFDSRQVGTHTITFSFAANVTRGHYHLECYVLHTPTHDYLARLCPAAMFSIDDAGACRGITAIKLVATTDALVSH